MKKIWVFRHGPKKTGSSKGGSPAPTMPLSPEGEKITENIAVQTLKGQEFVLISTSPSVRAYQTGAIFSTALGAGFPVINEGLGTPYSAEWEKVILKMTCPTSIDIFHGNPRLAVNEGHRLSMVIKKIAEYLPDGLQSLCVSHGGLIEFAMATVKARINGASWRDQLMQIKDLEEGEGVIFQLDTNNNFVGLEELRH